jgi:hypothetical protein
MLTSPKRTEREEVMLAYHTRANSALRKQQSTFPREMSRRRFGVSTLHIVTQANCSICAHAMSVFAPMFYSVVEINAEQIADRADRAEILAAIHLNDNRLPVFKIDDGKWHSLSSHYAYRDVSV